MELSLNSAHSIAAPVQLVCSDGELIRRTLTGEREAFGELALRHEHALFRHLIRRTGDSEEAQDLAQESLLRAYRSLPKMRDASGFKPWLLRIATNLACDAARRRGCVRFEELSDDVELPAQGAQPQDRLEAEALSGRLSAAVAQLPPLMAAAVNLHYREEMKVSQVAEIMQRDVGTVRVMLHRARLRLRQLLLGEQGGEV